MATISIRIQDEVLEELNKRSRSLHIPRAEYVRQALIAMNKQVDRELRKKRIMESITFFPAVPPKDFLRFII